MTRPRVLVVGCASQTPHGRDQMRRVSLQARSRDLHLIGADTRENLVRAPADLLDELVELPVHDADACRVWATGRPPVDAAFTFREMCVEPVAAIADELGIAGNRPEAVHVIRRKDLARRRLGDAGFAQPRSLLTADAREASEFLRETGPGPWIVKPRAGMGSEGVSLVRDAGDVPAALSRLERGEPFLVETFVAGREYSAEGLCLGGMPRVLAITEKFTTAAFVETGHRVPGRLDDATARDARSAVERALVVVGITHGIFHVELWVTGNGIVLGELHARPGGDFIHALVEYGRPGLELYGTMVDDLLSRDAPPVPDQRAAAGVDYLVLPPGRVRCIHGWETVARDESVIAAHLGIRPGNQLRPVRSSADRHGVLAVGAPTMSEVEAALTRLKEVLHVDVDPQPPVAENG